MQLLGSGPTPVALDHCQQYVNVARTAVAAALFKFVM